jgi:hypothetical protein
VCKTLDQQQLTEGVNLGIGGRSEQKLAQVIMPNITGTLAELRLWAACSAGSRLTVALQGLGSDGRPDGVAWASTTADGEFMRPHVFIFSGRVSLTAGLPFAVVLTTTTDGACACNASSADAYPGAAYYDSRPNAPGWVRNNNDLMFETIMN